MLTYYLWFKALHIIFMVTWFAGLFYLPRLFVYHAMSQDAVSIERFKIMERKLFFGIMAPGAILTLLFGVAMLIANPMWLKQGWIHAKLTLIVVLIGYHIWCGKLLLDFKADRNRYSHVWYRWFNEVPAVLLIVIVLLATFKSF